MNTTAHAILTRWNGRRTETADVVLHRNITGWWSVAVNGRHGMSTQEWAPQFEVYRAKLDEMRAAGWRVCDA